MAKNHTAEEILCLLQKLSEVEKNKVYSEIKKLMFAEQERKEKELEKYLSGILQDDAEWGDD